MVESERTTMEGLSFNDSDHSIDDDELNLLNEVLLVLDSNSRKLGGCSISLAGRKLSIIEDIQIDPSFTDFTRMLLNSILSRFEPTKVIISSRLDEDISKVLEEQRCIRNYTLDVYKSRSFNTAAAMTAIQKLMSSGCPIEICPTLNGLLYSSQSSMAVLSFSALINAIESCDLLYNRDVSSHIFFQFAEYYSPAGTMHIDLESLYSLKVFQGNDKGGQEKHNNLFDLVNHTHSVLGYKLLKHWFNCPLSSISLINKRLDTIGVLISEENIQYTGKLANFQKHIPNINHTMSSIQLGKPNIKGWKNIVGFLEKGLEICETVKCLQNRDSVQILAAILNRIEVGRFRELNTKVNQIIDFDLSIQWKRIYIRDGIDSELDRLRSNYDQLETTLAVAASEICTKYPNLDSDTINVVYIAQLGYLISLEIDSEVDTPEAWVETFSTSTNNYFKDDYTLDMDDNLYDMYQVMVDLEIEFLVELQLELPKYSQMLLEAGELFAELDCIMSLAFASMLNSYVKPELVESEVLEIKGGRHPLYEHLVSSYIPNDTIIEETQVSVITGANASGKSVYLSQIGLIVYLAHIGCYVPAESAKIGLTDKILTRIATMESLEKCESTFFMDLQKMSKNLQLATGRSLLLIDEFGKGTDVIGGPALLGSIIEELSKNECASRTLITTHFHELFRKDVLPPSPRVVHSHMEVMFQPRNEHSKEDEKLVYLYQLKEGLATNSFGINCAKACGIPPEIIKRAFAIMNEGCFLSRKEGIIEKETITRAKHIAREFLSWDLESCSLGKEELTDRLYRILEGVERMNTSD